MIIIASALLLVLFAAIFAVFAGIPVMLLWNWLMPALFGLPVIGFFQAVGLSFLCRILFGTGSTSTKKD